MRRIEDHWMWWGVHCSAAWWRGIDMTLLTAYDNPCSTTLISPRILNFIMLQISGNANALWLLELPCIYTVPHILTFLCALSSECLLKLLLQCCLCLTSLTYCHIINLSSHLVQYALLCNLWCSLICSVQASGDTSCQTTKLFISGMGV